MNYQLMSIKDQQLEKSGKKLGTSKLDLNFLWFQVFGYEKIQLLSETEVQIYLNYILQVSGICFRKLFLYKHTLTVSICYLPSQKKDFGEFDYTFLLFSCNEQRTKPNLEPLALTAIRCIAIISYSFKVFLHAAIPSNERFTHATIKKNERITIS